MRNRRSGFSLIEVMISIGVLALIALAIYALIDVATVGYNDTARKDTLQQNGRNALERIAADMRYADTATFSLSTETNTDPVTKKYYSTQRISFKKATGYDSTAQATEYEEAVEYYWEFSQADANNNGKQDEGRLMCVFTDWRTGKAVANSPAVVCDYVQMGGFTIVEDSVTKGKYVLTLKLSMVDAKQETISTTVTTTVLRRNRAI